MINKKFNLTILGILLICLGIVSNNLSEILLTNENFYNDNEVNLKNAGSWELFPYIIDDGGGGDYTWAEAVMEEWCSGSGTWNDPYIIENVTVNGGGSGNCILIRDSSVYFVIRNCTVYNSGTSDAGIQLLNVYNSQLIDNNCSSNYYGIDLRYSVNNTLSGNNASNNDDNGIYLDQSDNNTLSGNIANNNNYNGIYLYNSDNNTLSGNTASNNNNRGIYLDNSNNNTLSGNLMNFCGISLEGSLVGMASHIIDDTNLVNNKPVYYYVNELGLGSSNFTNAGQIILINCSNSIISGFNLSNGTTGIYLGYSNNNMLSGNTANNNHIGVDLRYSNNNTLSGNNVNNNFLGIYLFYSNNNTLSGNNVNNHYLGIDLWYSDNNILSGNTIHNSTYIGVELMGSNNNVLLGNIMNTKGIWIGGSQEHMASQTIDTTNLANDKPIYYYIDKVGLKPSNFTNAGQIILVNCNDSFISGIYFTFVYAGITLWYCDNNTLSENTANNNFIGINLGWSSNTKISGNTANNNDYGIGLSYGENNVLSGNIVNNNIYGISVMMCEKNTLSENLIRDNTLYGIFIGWIQSTQNLIFKNTFLNNTVHAYDSGLNNYWNNSIIGNYWDNYTGEDANYDGIGDTPYTFYGSTDYLPIVDSTAPSITINAPITLEIFGRTAPDFTVEITDILLDTMWYTIDNGVTNITFTSNGTINQVLWDALPEGNVVLRFYANDTLGRIGFQEVTVVKMISQSNPPEIPGYNILLLLGIVSTIAIIIIKKRLNRLN